MPLSWSEGGVFGTDGYAPKSSASRITVERLTSDQPKHWSDSTMAITRYTRRPFTPWTDIDDINDLMNRFFTRPAVAQGLGTGVTEWVPAVNMIENADAFEVSAELPGFATEDVEIDFENDVLTLRGETTQERTEGDEKQRYHVWERRSGSFQRSFQLPGTIDGDKITAAFVDGVLTIRLPKAAETKGRKIQISPTIES